MNVEDISAALQNDLGFEAGTAAAWARSGGRCEYCDRDLIGDRLGYACSQVDHLLPKARYPDLEWSPHDNRALSCSLCNSLKGSYDPLEPGEDPLVMVTRHRGVLLARSRAEIEKRRVDADRDWHYAKGLIPPPCHGSDRHAARRPNIATPTNTALFHTHIVVDWSARSGRSPEQPSKDTIWWAVAHTDGGAAKAPEYARTRHDALCRIARLVADELDAGRRLLVGFDFPFGYPAGVAEHLTGRACALALWDWLAERIEDGADNTNNRYKVAAEMNAFYCGLGPFWGRPQTWSFPTIPEKGKARTCRDTHPREHRIADCHAKGAKTVWQLAYAGSVGSQVLLGLPALKRLLADPLIRGRGAVWPFDTGLSAPDAPAVIAEVYPSLLKEKVAERKHDDEILDRAQVRVNADAFARLDAGGGLAPLFAGAPSLTPAERLLVESEEAWILGLGHEEALEDALAPV